MTGVTPTTNLNLLGRDNLTISGANLPWDLSTSTVSITFGDAQSTTCVPQSSTSTELVCLTSPFDATASAGGSTTMIIVINGATVMNLASLAFMTSTMPC